MRHTTSWQWVNWTFAALISGGAGWLCAPVAGQALVLGHPALSGATSATTQPTGAVTFKVAANAPTDGDLSPAVEVAAEPVNKAESASHLGQAVSAQANPSHLAIAPIAATMPAATQPGAAGEHKVGAGSTGAVAGPFAAADLSPKDPGGGAAPVTRVVPAQEKLPLGRATPVSTDKSERKAGAESSWWITTATALGIVIGLILILRSVVKRWSGRSGATAPSPLVEVLARVAVAPRNHVLLVRLGPRILVFSDSQAGLQLLANIEDGEEVAGLLATLEAGKPDSISGGFGQLMRKMTGDFRREQELDDQGADVGEFLVDHSRNEISGLTARLRTLGQPERRA